MRLATKWELTIQIRQKIKKLNICKYFIEKKNYRLIFVHFIQNECITFNKLKFVNFKSHTSPEPTILKLSVSISRLILAVFLTHDLIFLTGWAKQVKNTSYTKTTLPLLNFRFLLKKKSFSVVNFHSTSKVYKRNALVSIK